MTVIHGYRHTDAVCPYCGASYGMIETTDDVGVYRYRCWCGAKCKVTLDADERFDADGNVVKLQERSGS